MIGSSTKHNEAILSEDQTSRPTRKDQRNRRLEEQLRDNLRKRKDLARARKAPVPEGPGTGESSPGTPRPGGE